MKVSHFLSILFVALLPLTSHAGLSEVDILVEKERVAQDKERRDGDMTVTTNTVIYDVEIKSRSFKALENLSVGYMVFYEVAEHGSKDKGVEKFVKGKETIGTLGKSAVFSFKTKPVSLSKVELDGNVYWTSGASGRSRDKMVGVWVRVFSGDALIAEYTNPSTLGRKQVWKD